ncbi:MAG: ABC transporter permease [Acidimicrobiia bacterium]|nr:ABC transporter permease [Acidimicrobiia bacterium]
MDATLATIVAISTPLIFAVIGETITEKAGVINLSLDGTLMLSAMVGFAGAYETGSVIVGFLAAAIVSALAALLIAWSSIALRLNQVAVGFVLFLLATELSRFLGDAYVRTPGPTVTYRPIPLLADIPFVGTIFFDHDLVVYLSIALIFATWWFMYRTRRGMKLQAVGERPEGAHARGINVNRLRYLYTAAGGALVGIGGAAYSLNAKIGWSENHIVGFGWIALAIVIFGGWHPYRAAFGVYLFGALQFSAIKLQPVFPDLTQVLGILPFPIMIFTLVLVYSERVRNLTDRYPALRGILSSDPPTAIGTRFEVD